MAIIRPFRALRPRPGDAAGIAAEPYDVVTTEEARLQAEGNPLSFLRVSRAELEFPPLTDPFSAEVYERAVENFERLKKTALVVEDEPSVYSYRLGSGSHEQTGLAACFSLDEYDRDAIKKHERTRRDKEDDRTRHMLALGAQTGPVFLVYRAAAEIDEAIVTATSVEPLFAFTAADGVRHAIWRHTGRARDEIVAAFAAIPSLYIADGHHRAASAARSRRDISSRAITRRSLGDGADYTTFLGVAFPDNQVRILPYNRIVKDLGGLSADVFVRAVGERFDVTAGAPTPARRGEISMYVNRRWLALRSANAPRRNDGIESFDVSVLQEQLLAPIIGIVDIRTDPRIDFVGGGRGTGELERLVDTGQAAAAFSLYPLSVADLMTVCDAGSIMPPKSTWFDPKLRDGLLIHLI
jgi:uncharacterized protein (DUF1015 family)